MPTPEQHALLGASSAHIWLKCSAMPRAAEHAEDKGSEYAAEGTLAHAICELFARKYIEPMGQRTFNTRLNKLKRDPLFQQEMLGCAEEYLDTVKALALSYPSKPTMAVEQHVKYGEWAPEGFGRADFVAVGGDTLDVIDYKHGKGKFVQVEDNPQMKLYALGAYALHRVLNNIRRIRLTIVQPRLHNIATWELSVDDLLAWGESIKPVAQAAFCGFGTFCPSEECQFCRINGDCKAQAESCFAAIEEAAAPTGGMHLPTPPCNPTLAPEEVAGYLDKLRALGVENWIKKLTAHALGEILKGNAIPGYKAVEGRGNRNYDDQGIAFKALNAAGYDDAVLYDSVPKSVTAVEGLLGKKKCQELIGGHIVHTQGKPTLAPEADPRKPFQQTSVEDDFSTPPPAPASGQ